MRSEWPICLLEEVAAAQEGAIAIGPFGSRLKADAYTDSGVALIRGTNLSGSKFLTGEFVYISEETARGLGNANVKPWDLVFPHRGNIGAVGLVPEGHQRYALSTSLMKATPDRDRVLPLFMYYYFRSTQGRAELLKNASQVGTPGIATPLTSLRACVVPVPPMEEQMAIAGLLSMLDDRIEILRQTNATLESIPRALFKSWFIDFDPVRAKAEGREPEGMDAATAVLFPSEVEESELGTLPKGWKALPFSETIEILGGGTPKTSVPEYWEGDIPWFSVVDAAADGQVFTISTEKHVTDAGVANSSTRILPPWTTIISARGTVGKLAMTGRPMAMNQSCYGLAPKLPGCEPMVYLSSQRIVEELKRLAHGGVFDTITRATLASVKVVTPEPQVALAFCALVRPIFERIQLGCEHAQALSQLRDTLLPRLISGKLRLPEAEAAIEAVA